MAHRYLTTRGLPSPQTDPPQSLAARRLLALGLILAFALAGIAQAGTMSASNTPPIVDGGDIAMLNVAGQFDTGGDEGHLWSDRPFQGQTFTTLSAAGGYILTAVTLRNHSGNQTNNGADWTVRVGTVSGNTLTQIALETETEPVTYATGDYLTFTFAAPVALESNTVYGFDFYPAGSGFVTANNADGNYVGGTNFRHGDDGIPADGSLLFPGDDRVFHVDMTANPSINANLVAHWTFDNPANVGEATISDDLEVAGDAAYSSAGKIGGALSLDGAGDYLRLNGSHGLPTGVPIGDGSYSISAWMQTSTSADMGIIGWGQFGSGLQVNAFRTSTISSGTLINYAWGSDHVRTAPGIFNGAWHHVVATYDSATSTRRLYLNGVELGSNDPGADFSVTAANFRIGSTNHGEYMNGLIDDVRVYDSALSPAIVLALATAAGEINVTGNGQSIVAGDTSPDEADHTDFGEVILGNNLVRTFTIESPGPLSLGSYLNTSSTVIFPNASLADVSIVGGTLNGGFVNGPLDGSAYHFANNGNTATYQLQALDGIYTKCVKVELTQSGADIAGRAVYARYINTHDLGYNFESGAITNGIATSDAAGGYGVATTTLNQLTRNTFLPTTSTVIFRNARLADYSSASGTINGDVGGGWVNSGTPLAGTVFFFTNDGSTATYQMQALDGTYTKCVKVEFTQSGADIAGRVLYARYNTSGLGYDFDSGGTTDAPISTGGNGYGAATTTLAAGINISSVAVSGSADFVLGGITTPTAVTAGNSSTFTVTYTPSDVGVDTGIVTIVNDDDDESTYTFSIEGTGGNVIDVDADDGTPGDAGDGGADGFVINDIGGGMVEVIPNGGTPINADIGDFITITGSGDADTLTVNIGAGGFPSNIKYNGGAGNDSLTVNGVSGNVNYEPTTTTDGNLTIGGQLLVFTGLEPIVLNGTAADVIIDVTAPGAQTIDISADATTTTVDANGGFESLAFPNASNSFTVNAGDGADTINFNAYLGAAVTVSLNGEAGDDTISTTYTNVSGNTAFSVDGGADTDTLTFNDENNGSSNSGTPNGTISGGGLAPVLAYTSIESIVDVVPLYSYYAFDGDATDDGTRGITANEIGGPAYSAGLFGSALDLRGEPDGQYIQAAGTENDYDFTADGLSVSIWVQLDGDDWNESWEAIMAKGEGGGWRFHRSGGSNTQLHSQQGGNFNADLTDNAWHHLFYAIGNSLGPNDSDVWFDGVQVLDNTAGNPGDRGNAMQIGGNPDAGNRNFGGLIDDVGMWIGNMGDELGPAIHSLATDTSVIALAYDVGDVDELNQAFTALPLGGTVTINNNLWTKVAADPSTGRFVELDGAAQGMNTIGPAFAYPDTLATTEDAIVTQAASGFMANDAGVSNKILKVNGTSLGGAGPTTIATPKGASFTITSDGAFSYDPRFVSAIRTALAAGDALTDSFTYTIQETGSTTTSQATVVVTVTGTGSDTGSTTEDSVANQVEGNTDLRFNDNLVGSTIFSIDAASAQGATVAANTDGTFTYDPTAVAAFQTLAPGATATDTFSYVARLASGWTVKFIDTSTGSLGGNVTNAEVPLAEATGTGSFTASDGITYNVTSFVDPHTPAPVAINYGNDGHFGGDSSWPNGVSAGTDLTNTALSGRVSVIIPAGTYSVGCGSDDGCIFRFEDGNVTFDSDFGDLDPDQGTGMSQVVHNGGRGHQFTMGVIRVPVETTETVLTLFAQGGGGDSFDAVIATGDLSALGEGGVIAANGYQLLTDGAAGWIFAEQQSHNVLFTVTGLNDAPDLTENVGPSPGGGTDSATPLELNVADLINNGASSTTVDDPDGPAQSIAITGVTGFGTGTWQYSINGGGSYTDFPGGLGAASAVLLSETNGRIKYIPEPLGGAGVATFTFRAWDESSGSSGDAGVNTSLNGGTTGFSANTDTGDILVSDAFAFAPELVAAAPNSLGTITEDFAAQTFSLTDYIYNSATPPGGRTGVTDADGPPEFFEGVAIVGVSASAGIWAYSTDGTNFTNFSGSEADNNATLLPATNGKLRYTPGQMNGEPLTSVTFRAWDATVGIAGQTGVDASINGGASVFSSNTDTFQLTVLSVNDAPVLTAATPDFGQIEGADTATVFLTSFITNAVSAISTQITDDDTGQADDGIVITGISGAGAWQYSTDNGGAFLDVAAVTQASGQVILKANSQLRYVGAATTEVASVSYQAWDGSDGSPNSTTGLNAAVSGGTTAFSALQDVASLTLRSIVDAVDDTNATDEDTVINVAAAGVLANDVNIGVAYGSDYVSGQGASVTVNTDGSYQYDHTALTAFDSLAVGETATDSFSYTLANGTSATDAWTVTALAIGGGNGATDTGVGGIDEAIRIDAVARGLGATRAASDGAIYNITEYAVTNSTFIDFENGNSSGSDSFGSTIQYPGIAGGSNLVIKAQATVLFPAGTFYLSIGSDDQSSLRIQGTPITNTTNAEGFDAGLNMITNNCCGEARAEIVLAAPTIVHLTGMMYEGGGGDYFEIGIATTNTFPGSFTLFTPGAFGTTFLEQDEAEVVVTVNGVNDPPIAAADSAATDEDASVTIDTLANDSDPEGTTVSIVSGDSVSAKGAIITPTPPAGVGVTNLALGGTASQSSACCGDPGAGAAIDGDTNGAFNGGSVTHSGNNGGDDWWQVDLGSVQTIRQVVMYTRTDCCLTRTTNFEIQIFNGDPTGAGVLQDTVAEPGTAGAIYTADFPGLPAGDFVRVRLISNNFLSLAEVEVYGQGNPGFNYDPSESAEIRGALGAGDQTTDTFTYTIQDATGLTSVGTATVTINGTVTIEDDSYTTDEDSVLVGSDDGTATPADANDDALFANDGTIPAVTPQWTVTGISLQGGGGATDTQINNTAEALTLLDNVSAAGPITIGPTTYNVHTYHVDKRDRIDINNGQFPNDDNYPNGFGADDDITVRGTATFSIPAGTYTLAFGRDDGGRLSISGGITFHNKLGENFTSQPGPSPANEIQYNNTGGHNWTRGIFSVAATTVATVDTFFFERGGGDSFEVAIFNGARTDNDVNDPSWELLADGAAGWTMLAANNDLNYVVNAVQGSAVNVGTGAATTQGGTVTVLSDGTFSYDPTAALAFQQLVVGQTLTDTFTYTAINKNAQWRLTEIDLAGGSGGGSVFNNLTEAELLLDNGTASGTYTNGGDVYNFTYSTGTADVVDIGNSGGSFPGTAGYLNGVGNPSEITVRAIATFVVPPGTYTLAHGRDDAAVISVSSGSFSSKIDENLSGGYPSAANNIVFDSPGGHSWTSGVITYAAETVVTVTTFFREGGGGDSFEVAIYNGSNTTNNPNVSLNNGWELLGDGAAGWELIYAPETATVTVTVSGLNDAPVLDNTGDPTLTGTDEDNTSPGTAVSAFAGGIISDVDATGTVEGIGIVGISGNGTWQYDTGGGFVTLTGVNASSALLLDDDDSLRYIPDGLNAETPTVTFYAWDQTTGTVETLASPTPNGGTTAFSTATEVASLVVTAVNDAPEFDGSGAPTFTGTNEDTISPAETVATMLLTGAGGDPMTDVDNGAVEGIAIYATANNGTWQYDTGGGFTSFPTVNESTALLLRATDTVRYVPDGLNGETATISFYGWDQAFGTAGLTSNAVTRGGTTAFSTNADVASLISSALNDAPSLDNSGTPSILTTDEDTNSPATAVSAFLATGAGADPLTDPDFLPLEGIGIIATSGNGTWQYDTGGGFTSISGVTASSALLLRATDSLRYVPDQDNGETAFFTFLGWDQFAGTAGVLTNPNPNGGTTAYSTALDVGHIIVTHLNDAPVLDDSDVMDLTTITENETLNTGELVQDLINFSTANAGNAITDVDLPADPEGWAIVGSDVTGTGGGTWQYSTDSGATWVAMGTVNFNSALLLRAGGATDLVRFVPDAANATTANLTIYAWDQNTNSASERVDLATIGTGGTTAFSTEDEEDVTILVTAINDPPIISGTQQVTGLDDEFDTAVKPSSAFPFSTVTIIDVDLNPADNLTLTVTMDDCNKGSLDVGATGFAETGAGTRIYTYAAVNAGSATTAIRGLLFYPFENRIYPGSFDTSSFTIAVNDGTDTASDSATTVEVESINDVPEIVNTTTGQTVQDDQFLKPFEFTTLTDDDNNPGNRCTNAFTPAQVLGVSVVLDSGAKGELQHRISMPGGLAADNIDVWASTPSGIFDGVEVEFVNTLSDGTANATYNSANRRLIVNITSGVTCAYAVVDAVNALTGAFAFSAEMNNVTDANPNPGNDVVFAASSGMTSFSHLTQVSSSVYVTNTGNRDTVKSLLRILTFEPTEDRVGPGSTETTTLFVTMTDGLATVSDNTTTVISHGQNDAPTIPAQTLTVSEDAIIGTDITSLNGIDFLTTFLGADDDPGHTAALTYGIRPPGGSGAAAFSIALNGTITVADSSLIDFETNTLFKLEIIATDPLGATNGSFFEQKLGACNPATDDFLGSSVAVDGDYIAIGAKFADIGGDVDAGAVYVFEKSGLAWQQVSRLLPSVVAAGGNFGSAVALSGNLLLIGAEGQDQAFLFQRIGGSWTEITGPIVGSDTAGGDSFGASVDIDGTNYVIGAPLNDADGTDAGAAYLFGAVTTKLVPSDIQIGDLVGASVAIDGTSAIVSAPNEDSGGVDAGSAYVFVNGTEQGKLSPSDGQNADQFGTDVDIVGDTAIIGSALHDSEAFAAGAAYVFVRVAGVWEQQEKLVASDAALSDNFGAAVAITDELSNLTVAIGSPFDDDAGTDSGSIYTFVRDVNTNWLQDLKETADDGAADDRFGSRIDLDGKQLVVGAHFADVTKNATLYQDSGASYVINVDRGEICIVVVDANDPPVIADGSFTIDENVANLTAVGTVDSSDEDVADVLTHVIDAGNGGGAFQITAAGELQVLNLPGLNFEFTNSYVLTVRVNDNGAPSLSDTASITVTVNDINEAPVATDAIYTVDEHTAIGSQITTLNVTDEDSGQSLAHTITSGNSAGIFALDVNTGAITVANDTLLDFELTTSYTLTVLVVDNGSPSLSDTATITINVNDLNEAPVAVNVTYSILEDATAGTPVGTAGATDPDGDALIYNFTAGNTNTAFNIDGAGNITVNNPADFEATSQYVLSLDITDTGPLTTAITVTINLVEVNEDPVLVCPPGPGTMDELTTLSLTATATDSDLPAQTLTFSLGASTTALGVGINSSTGEFSWTPSEAQGPGVYNLTVCVSDTIATVCTTLSITVDDINSPPTLAAIGDKSAIEGIQLTFTAVGDDTDIPAQTISFSLNDPGGTGASIDGAGNFVWTPNANQGSVGGTPYVMSVIVTDSSGLSTSEQITITVYEAAASVGTPACWMNVAGLDLGPGSDVTRRVLDEPGEHRTFQAGAISCGCILGDNGFVQTTVDETTSSRMFGLSDDNDQGQHFSDILYAMFLDSNGQLSIYEEGGQAESFDAVTYVSGDILRVEVVGTTVNYLQNGLILYTSTRLVSQSDYPLKFDISMQTDGATLRDNVMSPQVPASPRIVDFVANDPSHTDNVLSAGDTLQIYFDSATNQPGGSVDSLFQFSQGLGSSYSGSWNNASCYGVTILDASGNGSPTIGVTTVSPLPGGTAINDASGASAASYVVSPVLRGDFGTTEPNTSGITWQNFINSAATPNSNDLLESSLNNHDYGAAVSVETFAYGDISIHFVPDQTDAEIFFGFTSLIGNSSSDPADIRYAAVLKTDGTFGAQTAETFQPDLGLSTYQAGDLITISIVGTTVTFYINGNLVHTSPVPVDPSDFPLAVDVSIGTGSISNARYSSSANVNAPPQLVSVVGNDPDDGDRILSGGDTITFTFDQATNQPTGQFASLFSSSATIGQTFSGGWTSALAYTVTITNPAGSTLTLDSSSFAVAGSTPITNAAGTSGGADASFGSITLSGDWGIVPLTAGNVVWENSTNATDGGGGTLNKTGSSNAWDAYGDSSASYLFGPAYTELAVVTVDQAYLFGFDVTGARPHNDTAAFGIKVDTFNTLHVLEGISQIGTFGTVRASDVLRVAIDAAGAVTYLKNDQVFYTSAQTASFPLEIVGSIFSGSGSIDGLVRSDPPVSFPPVLNSAIADDPDNLDEIVSNGDTITLKTDIATNSPGGAGVQAKAAVDALFTASVSLGGDYIGQWVTASCFRITLVNVSGEGGLTIDQTTLTPAGTTPILDAAGTSPASSASSPALAGDFGDVRNPGEDAIWTALYNVTVLASEPNTLCKSDTADVNQPAGAVTDQTIARNTRGEAYIEVDARVANRDRLIGFTEFDAITALSHITYGAMIDQQGRFLIYERGVLIGQFGSYTAGATIRVSMLSNQTVAYYVDGALRYTSADTILPTSDLPLRGAAYLQSAGAKISNARVSFPPAPVRFAQATAGAGYTLSILTSVATDQPAGAVDDLWSFSHVIGAAYSGSWTTPSVYVITVTDTTGSTLQAGLSTVTAAGTVPILDSTPVTLSPAANGTSPVMIGPFNAEDDGRAVNWSNVTNASVAADNTLCKTSPTALNTSGARSTASVLAGDAFLQFQIDALDKTYAVGWANSDPDHALNTIDFAFYVDGNNGGLGIRENGLTIADGFGTLAIDDVLRIELSGGQILYKKNGATIYTSLQTLDPADYPYHVDVSLITQGACAFNVRTSMPADDQPIITAFSVSDPDDLDAVYSNGDVFEVKFDRATNRAPNGNGNILNTAEVDDLFTVHNLLTGPAVLGTGYSGRWASASCFSITVTDISDTVGIELSQLVIIPIGLTPILDSTGTSDASEAPSPFLTGRFGLPNQIVWEIPRDVRIDASSLQRINDPGNASNWSAGAQSTIFLTTGSAYLETRVGETTTNRMIGWTSLPAFDPGDDHHFSTIEWAAYLTAGGQFKVWRRPGRFVENLGSYSVNDIIRVAIDPAGPSVTWSVNGAVRYTFTPVVGTESELRYPVRVRASIETFAGTILDGTTNITPPSIPSIIGYSSAGNGSDTPDPGETYTITFSQATDQPFDDTVTLETTDIDSLFIFNGSIGSAYTGVWTTPSIFTITIVDGSGGSTPVGSATVTARGGPAPLELVIRNAAGTSNAAFTTSPALTGSARSATSGSGDSASEALTEAVTVSLSAGWSLIALPITPLDASAATLFGDLPVSQIHSRVGDIDLPATDLSVGTGYWAYNAGEGTEAVIIGVRSSGSRDLPAGWSTVGVPVSTAVPAGAVAYRHENGAFVPVETLEPGTGYWLHLNAPTTLTW